MDLYLYVFAHFCLYTVRTSLFQLGSAAILYPSSSPVDSKRVESFPCDDWSGSS